MDWKETGGASSSAVTKPYKIAKEMNKYFLDKIDAIKSGIPQLPNLLLGPERIMRDKNCHLDLTLYQSARSKKF